MPISLVRALTENASTPAIPTAAMITARSAEQRDQLRVQPPRRHALVLDLRHGHHVLDRRRRRDAPHDRASPRTSAPPTLLSARITRPPPIASSCAKGMNIAARGFASRPPSCVLPTTPTIVRHSLLNGVNSQHFARPRDPFADRILAGEELVGERLIDDHDLAANRADRSRRTRVP